MRWGAALPVKRLGAELPGERGGKERYFRCESPPLGEGVRYFRCASPRHVRGGTSGVCLGWGAVLPAGVPMSRGVGWARYFRGVLGWGGGTSGGSPPRHVGGNRGTRSRSAPNPNSAAPTARTPNAPHGPNDSAWAAHPVRKPS